MKKIAFCILLYSVAFSKTYNLTEIYDSSFSNNESYEISTLRTQYYDEEVDKSISSFYPKIDLNTEYMKINEFPVVVDNVEKERRDKRRDVTLSVEQVLYDRSKYLEYEIKKDDFFRSEIDVKIEEQEVISNIIKYYLDSLLKAKQIELLNQKSKRLDVILQRASAKFENGFISKADYFEAKSQYDELKTQLIKATLDYRLSIQTLKKFSGLNDIEIKKNIGLSSFNMSFIDGFDKKIDENLDIQNQKIKLKQVDTKISQSKSKFEPILFLNYEEIVNDIPSSENEKSLSLVLKINLFNGSYDYTNYQQSRIEKNIETLSHNKLVKEVDLGIQNKITNIESYFKIIQNYPQVLESKKFILDGMQERFDMGTKSIVDLLDEEKEYFEKLNIFTQYKYQFLVEYSELMKYTNNLNKDFLSEMDRLIYE
jgi:outer membrane protein